MADNPPPEVHETQQILDALIFRAGRLRLEVARRGLEQLEPSVVRMAIEHGLSRGEKTVESGHRFRLRCRILDEGDHRVGVITQDLEVGEQRLVPHAVLR